MPISNERTTNKTLGHLSTIASSDKQNQIVPHTRVWAKVRKTFTLPLPVRVVAGHVAHSQRRRYHENAEVIYHRQPVFNL